MEKYDLNAPAFGSGAQKVTEAEAEVIPEVKPEIKETIEEAEEESKVPYSRFKKFHDAAKEAEEQAAFWKAKATAIENEPKPVTYNEDLPAQWVKLYGDDDKSKEAWKVQQDLNRQIREDIKKEALEAVRNERYEESQRTEQNVERLDESFEELSAFVGRDLTDKEQSALLDIVDDYTPKDQQGNYTGDLLPFNKAWEIYELKNQSSKSSKIQSRNQVAALSGFHSQAESSLTEKQERDKNFDPRDWNAYKKFIN